MVSGRLGEGGWSLAKTHQHASTRAAIDDASNLRAHGDVAIYEWLYLGQGLVEFLDVHNLKYGLQWSSRLEAKINHQEQERDGHREESREIAVSAVDALMKANTESASAQGAKQEEYTRKSCIPDQFQIVKKDTERQNQQKQ